MEEINEDFKEIKPQEGFQNQFLSSSADILIGGAAAGVGKSFALLLDPLRYTHIKDFGAVIFRRTTPQLKNQGGLWEVSNNIYSMIGGVAREYVLEWLFLDENRKNVVSRIKFNHMELEKNKYDHQGGQYAYIGFDELQQFSKTQFLYLLSRNRSTCGVRPCVRATCNPDPDSWLAEFISWWIGEDGFPIPERVGKLRYFVVDGDSFVWGDTREEVVGKAPHIFESEEFKNIDPKFLIKSVTFIPGKISENKELLDKDPAYMANLLALPKEEQQRLLKGNWKISQDGLALFNYQKIVDLFSNHIEKIKEYIITCDVARFGRDLTVILVWEGLRVLKVVILTHSKTTEVVDEIEKQRKIYHVSKSNVLVDEAGIGGGVVDEGEFVGFVANATPLPNPKNETKENYANLKTQLYYHFADAVNKGEVAIDENFYVDGENSIDIRIGQEIFEIKKLIREDLRAIKRKKMIKDEKLSINSKDEQKIILGGRSPDFGDSLSMRMYFEFAEEVVFDFV